MVPIWTMGMVATAAVTAVAWMLLLLLLLDGFLVWFGSLMPSTLALTFIDSLVVDSCRRLWSSTHVNDTATTNHLTPPYNLHE